MEVQIYDICMRQMTLLFDVLHVFLFSGKQHLPRSEVCPKHKYNKLDHESAAK